MFPRYAETGFWLIVAWCSFIRVFHEFFLTLTNLELLVSALLDIFIQLFLCIPIVLLNQFVLEFRNFLQSFFGFP